MKCTEESSILEQFIILSRLWTFKFFLSETLRTFFVFVLSVVICVVCSTTDAQIEITSAQDSKQNTGF